ncbi:MAG: redox-sensing transcriptional repressor Rex [Candidatus Margulisiibacteriota bacterium]
MITDKTLERLIIYRVYLERLSKESVTNIFSHQMAEYTGYTAAQVRRDLMAVGYSGSPQKGYEVEDLIKGIKNVLEPAEGIPMVIIGLGNLGRAILKYFSVLGDTFKLVAVFDNDPYKVNRMISGCKCLHIDDLAEVVKKNNIQLAVITVPGSAAEDIAEQVIKAGIKGLINFAPVRIKSRSSINVENIDMRMMFEKVAYFSRALSAGE